MYKNLLEARQRHERNGGCFFSDSTKRFFASRWGDTLYGGRYFITSEADKPRLDRVWTVRDVDEEGNISVVGKFGQYRSWKYARRAVARLLQ